MLSILICSLIFALDVCGSSARGESEAKIWTEVVVSHYAEDLGWLSKYSRPDTTFTVYSKSDGTVHTPNTKVKLVRLPNVGREGHTYLHHIVENYENLAPWTVFKQGSRPAQGYIPAEGSSGHFNSDVSLEDYIQPFPSGRDSKFVMTAAAHFPSGLQLTRPGLAINGLERKPLSSTMCPRTWTPWWLEKLHIYCKNFEPSMLEFYDRFVARSTSNSTSLMLAFPQGGIFAVSRDRIRVRPQQYYATLLDQVSKETDPIQGYWLEASWYDIFHPETLQSQQSVCEYPSLPDGEDTLPYGDMFTGWVHSISKSKFMAHESGWDKSALRKLSMNSKGPSSGRVPSSMKAPSSIKAPSSVMTAAPSPGASKIVTSFDSDIIVENFTAFSEEAFKKSVATVAGVDPSNVTIKSKTYAVKVGYSFNGTLTTDQIKTAIADQQAVSENDVDVIVARRLDSLRLLANHEMSVTAIIRTRDASQVSAMAAKAEDIVMLMESIKKTADADVMPTVTEAVKQLVVLHAEITIDGMTAAPAPDAESLTTEMNEELNTTVTAKVSNVEQVQTYTDDDLSGASPLHSCFLWRVLIVSSGCVALQTKWGGQ